MNDRNRRDLIDRVAKANGVNLGHAFLMGNGTFNGSENARDVAAEIYSAMRTVVRAEMAGEKKASMKKDLVSLAELYAALDKPGANAHGIRAKCSEIVNKYPEPYAKTDAVELVSEYIKETIDGAELIVKHVGGSLNSGIIKEGVGILREMLETVDEYLFDGASDAANDVAFEVLGNVKAWREACAMKTVSGVDKLRAARADLEEWKKLIKVPTPKERVTEKSRVKLGGSEAFSLIFKLDPIRRKGDQFFKVIEEQRAALGKEEQDRGMVKALDDKMAALAAELKQAKLDTVNGKMTVADYKKKEQNLMIAAQQIKNQKTSVEQHCRLIEAQNRAIRSMMDNYELVKLQYDFYNETNWVYFVNLFDEKYFAYDKFIKALNIGGSQNIAIVNEDLKAFYQTIADRVREIEEASRETQEVTTSTLDLGEISTGEIQIDDDVKNLMGGNTSASDDEEIERLRRELGMEPAAGGKESVSASDVDALFRDSADLLS